MDGVELRGIISETEAYMGVTDRASHAYGGRRTKRTETMYLEGGYAYVYLIYGIYSCMNITASHTDNPEAVLIRAVYSPESVGALIGNLKKHGGKSNALWTKEHLSEKEIYSLTNGPGKLCRAFGLSREHDACDMMSDHLYLCDEGYTAEEIVASPRIGIDYAGEAAAYPWRFTASCRGGVPSFISACCDP